MCNNLYEQPKIVEDFLNYMRYTKRSADNTIKSYSHDLHLFFKHLIDINFINKDIKDITIDDIKEIKVSQIHSFINCMSGNENAESTVNRRIATLKKFYYFLNLEDLIEKNPMIKIDSLRVATGEKREMIEIELYNEIISAIEYKNKKQLVNRNKLIFEVLMNCGLRISELVNLTVNCIDFTNKKINIQLSKGKKSRVVYMNDSLVDSIQKWYKDRNIILSKVDSKSDYVFISEKGKQISVGAVRSLFEDILEFITVTGEEDKYKEKTLHSFRHSFITLLLNNGIDISTVQKLAGHSSVSTTGLYANSIESSMREASEVMNNLLVTE